jgi:hypothetical protein
MGLDQGSREIVAERVLIFFIKTRDSIGTAVPLNPFFLALATNFGTNRFDPQLNIIGSRPPRAVRAKMPYISTLSLPVTKTIEACLIQRNHEIFRFSKRVNSSPFLIAIDALAIGAVERRTSITAAPNFMLRSPVESSIRRDLCPDSPFAL